MVAEGGRGDKKAGHPGSRGLLAPGFLDSHVSDCEIVGRRKILGVQDCFGRGKIMTVQDCSLLLDVR